MRRHKEDKRNQFLNKWVKISDASRVQTIVTEEPETKLQSKLAD